MSGTQKNKVDSVRQELLLRMYDQMFNDIHRHITVVWQPITVIVGSVTLLVAGATEVISIDIAEALIILLVGWLIVTLYDSSYWYNRNLAIIANIERQFLKQSDLREIHYYFREHRAKYSMLTHLRIQWTLGLLVGSLILIHHFLTEVLKMWPSIPSSANPFRWEVILPYVAVALALIWVCVVRKQRIDSYKKFIKNSPGIEVDTKGIDY